MLTSALKFRKALDKLVDDDEPYMIYFLEDDSGKKKGPPKDIDRANVEVFVKFLESFYKVTLKFSASLSVTSHMYFHDLYSIQSKLTSFAESEDFLLGRLV